MIYLGSSKAGTGNQGEAGRGGGVSEQGEGDIGP